MGAKRAPRGPGVEEAGVGQQKRGTEGCGAGARTPCCSAFLLDPHPRQDKHGWALELPLLEPEQPHPSPVLWGLQPGVRQWWREKL